MVHKRIAKHRKNSEQHDHKPASLWHAEKARDVISFIGSREQGLTEDEVRQRLELHGPNRLPQPRRRGRLVRLLYQFHNLFIYVLLAAALITGLLSHWLDLSVILAVVAINALIGFIQEGKAEKALESIRSMLSLHASVLRQGRQTTVPAAELVPGDMVFVPSNQGTKCRPICGSCG
jgi:magnesium-transporting ATPase (P-type)